jgi:hypothetical protein
MVFCCAQELAKLGEEERSSVLQACGVPAEKVADTEKTLLSLPDVHITAVKAFVEGEEDVKEQDMLTVQVFVAITRACHGSMAALPSLGKAPVQAHAPRYPHVVREKWCAFRLPLDCCGTWTLSRFAVEALYSNIAFLCPC